MNNLTLTEAKFLLELVKQLRSQLGEKGHRKLIKRMGSDVIRSTEHKLRGITIGDIDVQQHRSGPSVQREL